MPREFLNSNFRKEQFHRIASPGCGYKSGWVRSRREGYYVRCGGQKLRGCVGWKYEVTQIEDKRR